MTEREIKFRGKALHKKKWLYGSLLTLNDRHFIVSTEFSGNTIDAFEVDPKTIGQFTGLKDVRGQEIYEGDLVLCAYDCSDGTNVQYGVCIVFYCSTDGDVGFWVGTGYPSYYHYRNLNSKDYVYRVIGNESDRDKINYFIRGDDVYLQSCWSEDDEKHLQELLRK